MDKKYFERKRTAFLGLPLYFTTYTVGEDMICRKSGFFKTQEDNLFLYKVQDVRVTKTLIERMFKLGTIICYTGDVTDSEFRFEHIRNADIIKEYLLRQSEEERLRRRTINTMDIDADTGTIDTMDI